MMRTIPIGLALALSLGVSASAQQDQTDAEGKTLQERGEYLTNLAGCSHCHTAEGGKPFAGGYELDTPFGTLVTPNITPDKTGIGGWTQEDFTTALRQGIRKDGEPLYPGMPYDAYTKLTDDDVAAIWAHISTLEPVENKVDVVQLPFPYNVRPSVFVWQEMFFEPGRFEPDPDRDAQTNRGAYLVEALAHCSSCHTPRNPLGAQIASQKFQGNSAEQWYAPDISMGPNSVLSNWTEEELVGFLSREHSRNIPAFGPMGKMALSISQARPEDIAAIANYMKTAQPAVNSEDTPEPEPLPTDMASLGASVFASNCQSCHTESGEGKPGVAASLVNNGGVVAKSPNNVISVLLEGIAPNANYGVMPSFADKLSDEEIAAVANHVRRSWGNEGIDLAIPSRVASLRQLNSAPLGAVDLAVNCRSVTDEATTPELVAALKKRAQDGDAASGTINDTADAFAKARPDMTRGERIVAIGAIYCRELAIANPNMQKSLFLTTNLDFMEDVSKATRDTPRN